MEFKNLVNTNYSYGQPNQIVDLRDYMYNATNRACSRFWIISPFIGNYSFLSILFNFEKLLKFNVDLKLITDLKNFSTQNYKTIKFFAEHGIVKSIDDLHAKLYIIDNENIVTSANFTRKAYMCNWEIAVSSRDEAYKDIFNKKKKKSFPVSIEQLDELYIKSKENINNVNFSDKEEYEDRWELPSELCKNSNYETFYKAFKNLEILYKPYQKWKNTPLKFEIDSFLNYLFHEEGQPSYEYYGCNIYRQLDTREQQQEIEYWANKYHNWVESDKNTWDNADRRYTYSIIAKKTLIKDVDDITIDSFISILNECIESYKRMNKWLNCDKVVKTNSISQIKEFCKSLLKTDLKGIDKFIKNNKISGIGPSGIQELLGLCNDDLPIRNQNTNAGLRFLGYNV